MQWLHIVKLCGLLAKSSYFHKTVLYKYSDVAQLLLLCVCILFHRMKRFNEMPQEIDLNVQQIAILCVLQLESKIINTEQELQYLEDGGTQHKVNGHGSETVEGIFEYFVSSLSFLSLALVNSI